MPDARTDFFFGAGESWVSSSPDARASTTSADALFYRFGVNNPLNALAVMICLLFGLLAIVYAQPSQIKSWLSNGVFSNLLETESLSAVPNRTEDATPVSGRGLSPDILASSVPVSSLQNSEKEGLNLNRTGLLLRSSSYNISGIGGYPIFALPILSSDLAEILNKTQADLQTRDGDISTPFYHVNTTEWSFLVTVANITLRYSAIRAVIKRFLKLSSTTAAPQDIVSTRVGVIFNDSTPIADIIIMPFTPFGSSCAYQVVNETAALAPYLDHDSTTKDSNLTARSIETELLVPLGHTAYYMAYRLWRDPIYGIPVEVKVWAIKGVVLVALQLVLYGLIRNLWNTTPSFDINLIPSPFNGGTLDKNSLDTAYYVIGRMMARLVIQSMSNLAKLADPVTMALKIYVNIIKALLMPLQDMNAQDVAWAMEGEVYGPSNATDLGNSTVQHDERGREVIAKWQISIRDRDEL